MFRVQRCQTQADDMGSGASAQELKGRRLVSSKSRAIDRQISKDGEEASSKFKILLLGGSECGKTTIFKQMRVLHLNGFTKDDIIHHRSIVHQNCIEALDQLIEAAGKFKFVHDTGVKEDIDRFLKFKASVIPDADDEIIIPFVLGRVMERIWKSPAIQATYDRRFVFSLADSAKYFLDDISRLTEDVYSPTTQDILQCRNRTTGINELNFGYKDISFRMVDVGGQRTERRKWIHCFDNVDMILFVASMSDYDLFDPEDQQKNRMKQNYEIFKTICTSDFFNHASIVLFLNKYDIFCDKLTHASLKCCWENYQGDNSEENASAYVQRQFQKCVKKRQRFYHFKTTATNTNNIELVFGSAVAHIVSENLKATGLQE